jgi:hypothetical protein
MVDKVKVILKDGRIVRLSDWQMMYGLKPYSNDIGKHFSLSEKRFQEDLADYGELYLHELLIRLWDGYREAIGSATHLNSLNRNHDKQLQLKAQGARAAEFSPHEVHKSVSTFIHGGTASDIDTPGIEDLRRTRPGTDADLWQVALKINRDSARVMREVSKKLKINVRIGYEQYLDKGQTFIHVDVAPEFYAPGKPWNKYFHPIQWEKPITW